MRKKMIAVATASALTLGGLTVAPNEALAQTQSGSSTDFGKGVEKAFDPDNWKIEEGTTFKGFMKQVFLPYKMMFEGMGDNNIAKSSEGATRAVIQYGIIFAIVTVVGQVIQLVMSNVVR